MRHFTALKGKWKWLGGLLGRRKSGEVWFEWFNTGGWEIRISISRTISYKAFNFTEQFGVGNKVVDDHRGNACISWFGWSVVVLVLIGAYCLRLVVDWVHLIANAMVDDLWGGQSERVVIVTGEEGEENLCELPSSGSKAKMLQLDEQVVARGVSSDDTATESSGRFIEGARWLSWYCGRVKRKFDWRNNPTYSIRIRAGESYRIERKRYLERIPDMINV